MPREPIPGNTSKDSNLNMAPKPRTEQKRIKKPVDYKKIRSLEDLAGASQEKSEKGNVQKTLEQVLTKEQLALIETETKIGKITINDEGKIDIPDKVEADNEIAQWQLKEGVLDAKKYAGVRMVVFNANDRVPEGCPADLMERGRSGEYNPVSNTTFTDLSNTWDFLHDKYQPSWIQQKLRHELRHGVVSSLDQQKHTQTESQLRRVVDQDRLRASNPELAKQLGYLDELHSQYFDVVEGEINGHTSFRSLDSKFYSIEGSGTHLEVASFTFEGQETARDLFLHLQGLVLLKRMNEQQLNKGDVNNLIVGAGTVLATERSLVEADIKIKALWRGAMHDADLATEFNAFISTYEPSLSSNTPIVTQELRDVLV